MQSPAPARLSLQVACLCAAWCQLCESYRPTLLAVCAGLVERGLIAPPRWIDIEDEAELVGEVDIETFPTLLVYDAQRLLFAGPLTPHPETLLRLLERMAASDAAAFAAPPAMQALVGRLRAETGRSGKDG